MSGIHRWPVDSPHKGPEAPKMFPFGDVIMRQKNERLSYRQIIKPAKWQSYYSARWQFGNIVDQPHKSRTPPVPYSTMQHPEQKCTHFYFGWCTVGYEGGTMCNFRILSYKRVVLHADNATTIWSFCDNDSFFIVLVMMMLMMIWWCWWWWWWWW